MTHNLTLRDVFFDTLSLLYAFVAGSQVQRGNASAAFAVILALFVIRVCQFGLEELDREAAAERKET